MTTYAIGDVHGRLDALKEAHRLIAADRRRKGDRTSPVVHLGDLVDRGPDCRGVLDFLIAGIRARRPWLALKGNHDRMFSGFLDDPCARDPGLRPVFSWLHPAIGGAATLASYGVANAGDRPLGPVHAEALGAVPAGHRAFLATLPQWYLHGQVLFVHAGIRPGVPLEAQDETDLVWIREPFLSDRRDHGFLVVHGHTVVDMPEHRGNRVCIDTGAGHGGPLTAIVVEGRDVCVLTPGGRVPLRP